MKVRFFQFLKFIYSEKATKFCEISANYLTGSTLDKKLVEISQNFVAFSEYMNFNNVALGRLTKYLIISMKFVDFWPKIHLIYHPFHGDLTTHVAIIKG